MSERCTRAFDEALLSGYVDRVLTQADEQRVRVHLEDCAVCRAQVDEMLQLKEVTMSSTFRMPADDQWSEAPRGVSSRVAFRAGWALVVVWVAIVAGYGLWQFLTADEDLVDKLVAASVVSGVVLLFLSALIDRLKVFKTDRYRRVQK